LTQRLSNEDAWSVADRAPPHAPQRRLTDTIKEWSTATQAFAGAIGAVLALLVTLGVINAAKSDDGGTPTPTPTAAATRAAAHEVKLDSSTIGVRARPASLAPQGEAAGANDYIPDNLLDGDPRTAWVEGDKTGLGLPARLTFSLPHGVDLRRVRIVNGYAKDTAHLLDNAAARTIEIVTGTQTLRHTLTRTRRPQSVSAAFGHTRQVVIRILSGYPGARFDDLAVSEVAFFAKQR
jgi:hypothetical protein